MMQCWRKIQLPFKLREDRLLILAINNQKFDEKSTLHNEVFYSVYEKIVLHNKFQAHQEINWETFGFSTNNPYLDLS